MVCSVFVKRLLSDEINDDEEDNGDDDDGDDEDHGGDGNDDDKGGGGEGREDLYEAYLCLTSCSCHWPVDTPLEA